MSSFIDKPVIDRCWNLYDSYGMICVGCRCCSSDPLVRANARYELCLEQIVHLNVFDLWDDTPEGRELQKKNIASNLKYFRGRLRYYKKRLEEMEKNNVSQKKMEDKINEES